MVENTRKRLKGAKNKQKMYRLLFAFDKILEWLREGAYFSKNNPQFVGVTTPILLKFSGNNDTSLGLGKDPGSSL